MNTEPYLNAAAGPFNETSTQWTPDAAQAIHDLPFNDLRCRRVLCWNSRRSLR